MKFYFREDINSCGDHGVHTDRSSHELTREQAERLALRILSGEIYVDCFGRPETKLIIVDESNFAEVLRMRSVSEEIRED